MQLGLRMSRGMISHLILVILITCVSDLELDAWEQHLRGEALHIHEPRSKSFLFVHLTAQEDLLIKAQLSSWISISVS